MTTRTTSPFSSGFRNALGAPLPPFTPQTAQRTLDLAALGDPEACEYYTDAVDWLTNLAYAGQACFAKATLCAAQGAATCTGPSEDAYYNLKSN